ncbi:hypothetical protein AMK28_25050 [Streptomyces sp. CB02115]|nr:hypothetical protein AMK28_25050 [Streptomyces sp. CB02115]
MRLIGLTRRGLCVTPVLAFADEVVSPTVAFMSSDGVVVDEAVRAAWDAYRVLEKRTPAEERQQAQQRLKAAVESVGREEVSRGTVFLVGVLTGYLVAEPPGGGEQLDPLSDLVPAVIRRLPSFEMADPEQVPMVTGVLMAAAMGMDTVVWRDRFGTIEPKEAMVHGFVLWLLADLFDSLVDKPGTIDELMLETFETMGTSEG